MNRPFPSLLTGWLGGAALALLLIVPAAAQDTPEAAPGPDLGQLQPAEVPLPPEPSEYWLGIGFRPLGEALREQLGLSAEQGLLVDRVMPESPAARAEIRRHDIVVKADGKPLGIGKIPELNAVVDAAKDGELSLEIIRRGEPITIKVKPEKRPEGPVFEHPKPAPGHRRWGRMLERLEQVWPGPGEPPFQFRFFSPGVILPPGAPVHAPFPGDLSVTIHKEGGKPATIEVRRGDMELSINEDGMDTLPPDIRVHVERMLGGAPPDTVYPAPNSPHPPFAPPHTVYPVPTSPNPSLPPHTDGRARSYNYAPAPIAPHGEGRMEKRLEEMSRRIERLQGMVEELREKPPRGKGSDKKTPKPKKEQG